MLTAAEFLSRIHGNTASCELRMLNSARVVGRKMFEPQMQLPQDVNVYFGAWPRAAVGVLATSARCIWTDFDLEKHGLSCDAATVVSGCLAAAVPVPHILVHSGHGIHGYWLLNEEIDAFDAVRLMRALCKRLASVGADAACTDQNRLLRLPQTMNCKASPAVACNVAMVRDTPPLPLAAFGPLDDLPPMSAAAATQLAWVGKALTTAGLSFTEKADGTTVVTGVCPYCIKAKGAAYASKHGIGKGYVRGGWFRCRTERCHAAVSGGIPPDVWLADFGLNIDDFRKDTSKMQRINFEQLALEFMDTADVCYQASTKSWFQLQDDCVWSPLDSVGAVVGEWLLTKGKFTDASLRKVSSMIQTMAHTRMAAPANPPQLLAFKSHVYDFSTLQLRPTTREDFVRETAGYDVCDGPTPAFDATMKLISCGREDWQSYVLDLMAYCLTPDITQQRFWLYTGVGSNGKSTLAWLQRQLAPHLCHKASTSNPIVRGSGNRFSRIGYRGKFVSITDELDANTVLDSGMLKSLSGDELLRGEQKGMPEVEWRNTTKVIIQSSGFPAIYGDDGGVVRRFVAVPFEHIFAAGARDHKILDKLLTEIPAITALLLQRIPRVLSDGLREPECIRAATAHYLEEHDPGGVFFSTHVRFSPDAWVSITTLFKTYQLWAASVGRTHLLDQIGLVRQTIARSRGAAQKEKREGERGLRGVQIILDNIDIAT